MEKGIFYVDGTIICPTDGDISKKRGAKNVVVEPEGKITTPAITEDTGFYKIHLQREYIGSSGRYFKLDCLKVEQNNVTNFCKNQGRQFIGPDSISDEEFPVIKYRTISLDVSCDKIEGEYVTAKAYVDKSATLKESSSNGWIPTTAGGLIKLLTFMGFAGGAGEPTQPINITTERFPITSASGKRVSNGRFLDYAQDIFSQNVGFNFSPQRNLSESIFWNPARMAMSRNYAISLSTDYSEFLRSSLLIPIREDITAGFGIIWLHQEEDRTISYGPSDSTIAKEFKNDELGIYVGIGKQLAANTSIGLSIKGVFQSDEIPDHVLVTTSKFSDGSKRTDTELIKNTLSTSHIDGDISLSHNFTPYIKIGANIMNIGGTKVYTNTGKESLRSAGIGGVILHNQFNYGLDFRVKENGKNTASFGIDYVPINDMKINIGYSTGFSSRSINFKFYSFTAGYSRSNTFGDKYLIGFVIEL